MNYKDLFKMPKPVTIMARTSSITNAFVNGIIPCVFPSEDEIQKHLTILDMDKHNIRCAYCGDKYTEWDHFRPLVKNKKPTGYISEIANLVPACGKCNQSKGNKYWKDWISSTAILSPKTRGIQDLETRIFNLEKLEAQTEPTLLDFERMVGKELWQQHWDNCDTLHDKMKEAQELSDQIRDILKQPASDLSKNTVAAIVEVKQSLVFSTQPNDNSDYDALAVGIIANVNFRNMLESHILHSSLIEDLQKLEYCKRKFGINFAVLKQIKDEESISEQRKDALGRDRYYVTPLTILNGRYLLTSQWYERHKKNLTEFMFKALKNHVED